MSKHIVKGDLIAIADSGKLDVIIHGCNCFNTMGAGIALDIKQRWPEAYAADLETIKGDRNKLGLYTFAQVKTQADTDLIIINAYTQYTYARRRGEVVVDYDAISSVFKSVAQMLGDRRIGYPAIGAGLAGGNWNIISMLIDNELARSDHTFVQYVPKTLGA